MLKAEILGRVIRLTITIALGLGLSYEGFAEEGPKIPPEPGLVISKFIEGFEEEDLGKCMSCLGEDVQLENADGERFDYYTVGDDLQSQFNSNEKENIDCSQMKITVHDSRARCTFVADETTIYREDMPTGLFTCIGRFNVFSSLEKRGGEWLITRWTEKRLPARDTTPPTIVSTSPANGATGVSQTTDLTVTFSEPMQDPFTISFNPSGYFEDGISYNKDTHTFTWANSQALPSDTTFTITLNPSSMSSTNYFRDASGNYLARDQSFSFTTETAIPKPVQIEFLDTYIGRYNVEDITDTLTINRDDLVNGQVRIKGETDDGQDGAATKRIEIDLGDGRGWQAATGRTTWRYEFRPKRNFRYSIAMRAFDIAGKIHEPDFGRIEMIYEETGDEEAIKQVIFGFKKAHEEEDLEKCMSYLGEDIQWKEPDAEYDYYTLRDHWESHFDESEEKDLDFFQIKITVNRLRARCTFIANSKNTYDSFSDTGTTGLFYDFDREHVFSLLEKRRGKWLITQLTLKELPSLDTTPPTIASTSPANGATGVSRTTNLTITFSEQTESHSAIRFNPSGYWEGGRSYDKDTRTWTFSNSATLPSGTTFTITLNPSSYASTHYFRDASDNYLATDQSFSFTTE